MHVLQGQGYLHEPLQDQTLREEPQSRTLNMSQACGNVSEMQSAFYATCKQMLATHGGDWLQL
eukprot:2135510-Amphidinium_carterae.1